MTSSFLDIRPREQHEALLHRLHYHLDMAAKAAADIAELCDRPEGWTRRELPVLGGPAVVGHVRDCAEEWRTVRDWLGDSEEPLWHDHIIPAQEMLREVHEDE